MKWTPVLLLLLSGCGMITKIRQTKELGEAQELAKRIQIGLPELIHQNHALDIQFETPPEFTYDLPTFSTETLGTQAVDIPLHYKTVQLPYTVSYTVASSEPSAQFPLEEGYTWSYNTEMKNTTTTGRVLFFFPIKKHNKNTKQNSLSIEVGSPKIQGAHTEYTAQVIHEDIVQEVRLMGINGNTKYWDGTQWQQFVSVTPPKHEHSYAAEPISCSLAIPGFESCTCYAAPQGAVFAPPGPIDCLPFKRTSSTQMKKNKAAGFWFLISAGTLLLPDKQKTKTTHAFKLAEVKNIPASPRDTDVFWNALHPSKVISTRQWIHTAQQLSKKHTWDMEVAAALYLANTKTERRTVLVQLLEQHPDRRELIHLAPKGILRTQLEADLNIDVDVSFTKQILRRRAQFESGKDPHAVLSSVNLAIFNPKEDAVLLDHLSGLARNQLCLALARVLPKPTRQTWWDSSELGKAAQRARTLWHYETESKLGLVPEDPFLDDILPALFGETFKKNALPAIERAGKKHPISIAATRLILEHLTFDSTRISVIKVLLHGLPKEGREPLLHTFRFDKEEAAQLLGLPAP